ncbi:putative receptor-like protein kinase [Dendrobium catenatum]|uniref:Putative receptor-like protein kinase n=1 Tax=Dendrobium catenatum TaxID=906689 RepID=A0A2I0VS75_9ASPA|nr:putative receptor-like protein kinase [Dendrobium catenatum]
MSSSGSSLNDQLSQKTDVFGFKLWVVIGIGVGVLIFCVLCILVLCFAVWSRKRFTSKYHPTTQIPIVSKEIKEVRVEQVSADNFVPQDGILLTIHDKSIDMGPDKVMVHFDLGKSKHACDGSHLGSLHRTDREAGSQSGEDGNSRTITICKPSSSYPITSPSPLTGLPEFSHLGWGHWFTLRDLEIATNHFSKENVIGEGGYGIVYRGCLINGTPVAIKRLLNNLGQAEKEFGVEVEAIGHVRHKNLVRLLGYCVEGTQRYPKDAGIRVCKQWELRAVASWGFAPARLSHLGGSYKDSPRNCKGEGHGVKIFEGLGSLDRIVNIGELFIGKMFDAGDEVNLVDWLKMMVGNKRYDEVVDPNINTKPSTRALKRALLTALRCVDPDSEKRPKMGQVVRMLESDESMFRECKLYIVRPSSSIQQVLRFLSEGLKTKDTLGLFQWTNDINSLDHGLFIDHNDVKIQ